MNHTSIQLIKTKNIIKDSVKEDKLWWHREIIQKEKKMAGKFLCLAYLDG